MSKSVNHKYRTNAKIVSVTILYSIYLYAFLKGFNSTDILFANCINLTITTILICISILDIDRLKISDSHLKLFFLTIVISVLINPLDLTYEKLKDHLIAAFSAFTFIGALSISTKKVANRTLVGFGDAKLFAITGAFLGTDKSYAVIGLAFITAGLFSFAARTMNKIKRWQPFPFAPFICIAIQIVWILDKDFGIVQLFVR